MPYNNNIETQSLYIHWPFCPYKCHFCPFVAYAGHDSYMERYHKTLKAEIELFAKEQEKKAVVETIFFGGGTPSTYPDHLLLDMSAILRSTYAISEHAEISIEVNPGTVHDGQIQLWKDIGINRLSIGVQSLNDKVLHNLNRHQSATDVIRLIDNAHPLINNISIDLIIGLPGISVAEWKSLINTVVTWPITHISIYFLTIHEGTALYFRVKKNDVTLPVDEAIVDLYLWTVDELAQHGFEQYEISNFGKHGFTARHNQVYWSQKPYKGFGVGACSFDGASRFQNKKDLFKYLAAVEQADAIVEFEEQLTDDQKFLELLMLGLRQKKGILLTTLLEGCKTSQRSDVQQTINELVETNYLNYEKGYVRLTPSGLAVENEIIVRLSR